ncbi:MAG: presqualene diphosphate synthase HpnD [Rhodospirillaceae bacterium]|nr:presqualene diphosphate synthase HpnD [Rhodospirillaceae bacterium]MDD9928949.1 presqualene diphosphate synthase HpnD [Rhodospirillaceae bacterium]
MADVVARSGSSFRLGMRVMPRDGRDAMYAIYAFCREVDDVADEPGATEDKLRQLSEWRDEIDRLYEGQPTLPTTQALLDPVRDFALPKAEFMAVIDGMQMDADGPIWGPSFEELMLYCRRVAGAVGMLSIHAFGETRPPAPALAVSLGNALQLTNILRDVHEDAADGRLYLPRELLDKHNVRATEPGALLVDPALASVCADLAEHAKRAFAETEAILPRLDRRKMRPAILMKAVYQRTLAGLEARGWDRLAEPVRISRAEKVWIALRHSFFS